MILNIFCSTCLQKFPIVFEILRKEIFRGRPRYSLMGPFIEKLKIAYCWEHDSKQLWLNNAFQNVCRFRDIRGQRFAVLAPKTPYYVTYDVDFDMMRSRLSRSTVPLLTLITNYWQLKRYVLKTFDPFWPLIKGASPFCLVSQERSCHFKHFLFYKYSEILNRFWDIKERTF